MMSRRIRLFTIPASLVAWGLCSAVLAAPLGTAITYQGQLNSGGSPADGLHNFEFSLWDDAVAGGQIGATLVFDGAGANPPPIDVVQGLFTADLDFGDGAFDGAARWLQISVNGTPLTPRQRVAPAPLALALPGLYTRENASSPNVIGGFRGNEVGAGVVGATIGGGGSTGLINRILANYGTVGGGADNTSGSLGTVGGGGSNAASGTQATVSGGIANVASGNRSTIGGGESNTAAGFRSTTGGGHLNAANGENSTVGGGDSNTAVGEAAAIGGGGGNTADGSGATIAGGVLNAAGGQNSTISGGTNNVASVLGAVIGGGVLNAAGGEVSTVGGGWGNIIPTNAHYATIPGGGFNEARGNSSTVSGGRDNVAEGNTSAVAGGFNNQATGHSSTVGGGENNETLSAYAVVAGGEGNRASGDGATIGGGTSNMTSNEYAVIGGGESNTASGKSSAIGGGYQNMGSGGFTAIGGGTNNTASGHTATICGGASNTASGFFATVAGGGSNSAAGLTSLAAGRRAKAIHDGAFVWGDATDVDVLSSFPNEVTFRASGGYRLFTNSALTAGVEAFPGGGSWASISDRNMKENFDAVDGREVVERIAAMPITSWNYKAQDDSIRHMGPMAQDFHAAFDLGEDELRISTIDADGVLFAAVQGLHQIVQEKDARLVEQLREIDELRTRLERLERAILKAAETDEGDAR